MLPLSNCSSRNDYNENITDQNVERFLQLEKSRQSSKCRFGLSWGPALAMQFDVTVQPPIGAIAKLDHYHNCVFWLTTCLKLGDSVAKVPTEKFCIATLDIYIIP